MKEAAGEANMTVITIVLIGVIAAVGIVLVPRLLEGIKMKSCCTSAGLVWRKSNCYYVNKEDTENKKSDDYTRCLSEQGVSSSKRYVLFP